MKLGDRVMSKVGFKVTGIQNDWFAISFVDNTKWCVPIYLSALGIRLPAGDYVYPGDQHPAGHPDYYPRKEIRLSGERKKAVYEYAGYEVHLELGDDFHFTGEYFIRFIANNGKIRRTAQLRSEKERLDTASNMVGMTLEGGILTGIVTSIFVRYQSYPPYEGEVAVDFFSSTEEIDWEPNEIIVEIQDVSMIEYELPAHVLVKL